MSHWGLRMRRECRERFPRHRIQRKPLVSDPVMHHGTCVTYVPWHMSGSLTRGDGENVPGILGACATRDFMYLVRGPWGWHEEKVVTWLCPCLWIQPQWNRFKCKYLLNNHHIIIRPWEINLEQQTTPYTKKKVDNSKFMVRGITNVCWY